MKSTTAAAALLCVIPAVVGGACAKSTLSEPQSATPPASAHHDAAPGTASWDYHPAQPQTLRARLDLGPAQRLFVGDGGERWLVDARNGTAEAASSLADQELVAVAQFAPNAFAFVGANGTIYTSTSPVGSLTSTPRNGPAIWGIVVAGNALMGMQYDGTAVRSEDGGKTFSTIPVAAKLFDLAGAPDGRVMALAAPEELWISKDAAQTWTRVAVPTVGATSVLLDAGGALVAQGLHEYVIWAASREPEVRVIKHAIEPPALDLFTDVMPGPSAQAIVQGRAAIVGSRYFEAVPPGNEKGTWSLASGQLAGRTSRAAVPGTEDCKQIQVSASPTTLVLACTAKSARAENVLFPPLRLIVSQNQGTTFQTVATSLVADDEDTRVAVTSRGTFVLTGACKPAERGHCVPVVPWRLVPSPTGKKLHFVTAEASKLPPIVGRTGRLQVSPDGSRLYATAVFAQNRMPGVLISDDDGVSFRGEPLELPMLAADAGAPSSPLVSSVQPDALRVDATGRMSLVAHAPQGLLWLTLDRDAHLQSMWQLPAHVTQLEAVGPRALSLTPKTGEILESTDGGRSFHKIGRLPRNKPGDSTTPAMHCADAGCVVGESFSRLGWGESPVTASNPDKEPAAPIRNRTPIVCDVAESVGGDVPNASFEVDALRADRGKVAWTAEVIDTATASVRVLHGMHGPQQSVENVVLLPPTTADGMAVVVRQQAEGFAALRYRFERAIDGAVKLGSPMRQVEIAWDNQFQGKVRRVVIPDAGPLRQGDVSVPRKGEASGASVGLLSAADDGVFVCAHATCGQSGRDGTFLDSNGRPRAVVFPEWPSLGQRGRVSAPISRAARVGGRDLLVGEYLDGRLLARAHAAESGAQAFDALGLLPTAALARGFRATPTWAFRGGALAGLTVTITHRTHEGGFAFLLRGEASAGAGSLEPAPTMGELADPPKGCTEADKQSSLRSVVPPESGTRHPVIIHGANGSEQLLLTDFAVLYGTHGAACGSVFDTVRTSQVSPSTSALIDLGAMDRSWLFAASPTGGMRWRGMRCRFDPSATVPQSAVPLAQPESEPPEVSGPSATPEEASGMIFGVLGASSAAVGSVRPPHRQPPPVIHHGRVPRPSGSARPPASSTIPRRPTPPHGSARPPQVPRPSKPRH